MRRTAFTIALVIVAWAWPVAAETGFPNHPVTLTVGYAPGGGADLAARIVAKKLSENIGQAVVVENRAGAVGVVALHHVAAAPPDGYTISLAAVGPLAISPALYKDETFDARRDIAPITMGMTVPGLVVVNANLPVKTLGEFVALAKAKPGTLSYASAGVGGLSHLWIESFKQRAGIDIIHVPYKGAGPALNDLLAGRVAMYSGTAAAVLPHVQSGELRAIATHDSHRVSAMPDVPTVAESGYPGLETSNWFAFVAPAKTPKELLDFWNREITKVLNDPAVKADLVKHDLEPEPSTREELAHRIDAEMTKWARVVREAHITVN